MSFTSNTDKSKTVSPLIIQKSRIQSVPNQPLISPANFSPNDGFTTPKSSKRLPSPAHSPNNTQHKKHTTYVSQNRFSLFAANDTEEPVLQADNMDIVTEHTESPIIETKPPPPIFIRVVNDFNSFCSEIKEVTKGEQFSCKSTTNGLKLSTSSADSYRSVIKFLLSNKADFHTYQLKKDRPFRVVIRNLHHTTSPEEIKKELLSLGHTPRNITNVIQRSTKLPLPLFFVDLEPALNNKDIFKIEFLHYTKIKIEEPRLNHQTIQCLRCQGFGHTKSYCNHPPKCVRCGDSHLSSTCQKSSSLPAKCALCGGDHPANYRGCPIHKEHQSNQHLKKNYQGRINNVHPNNNVKPNTVSTTSNQIIPLSKSYSHAVDKNSNSQFNQTNIPFAVDSDPLTLKLSSFLDDFKSLINPLISLLTTVINKLLISNNDK